MRVSYNNDSTFFIQRLGLYKLRESVRLHLAPLAGSFNYFKQTGTLNPKP
jgi:hypothetical protein